MSGALRHCAVSAWGAPSAATLPPPGTKPAPRGAQELKLFGTPLALPALQTYVFVQVEVLGNLGDLLRTGLHAFAEEALQCSLHVGLNAGPAFSLPGLGQHLLCIAHLEVRDPTLGHRVTQGCPCSPTQTGTAGCRALRGKGFLPVTVPAQPQRCSKSSECCFTPCSRPHSQHPTTEPCRHRGDRCIFCLVPPACCPCSLPR